MIYFQIVVWLAELALIVSLTVLTVKNFRELRRGR